MSSPGKTRAPRETPPAGIDHAIQRRITALNLGRALWIAISTTLLSLVLYVLNVSESADPGMEAVQLLDLALSAVFIVLIFAARCGKLPETLRRLLPPAYAVFFVLLLGVYYFSAFPRFGDNVSYVFGVLVPCTLLVLPPRFFIPFLMANHLVFCWLLASVAGDDFRALIAGLAGGTAGAAVACMASLFLYRSKIAQFHKAHLLEVRNRELDLANDRLQARTDELDELMAIVAHDLRGPLRSLHALFELHAAESPWQHDPYRELLQTSSEACSDMSALVDRLLAAHESEHSIGQSPVQSCDLAALFSEAAERARRLADPKGIRLQMKLPDAPCSALGAPEGIARVLDNLLSNAIKYSPPDRTVVLDLTETPAGPCGEVRDEGPGISESEADQLFQKFQRGTNRPTAGEPSSGLGLFIARRTMLAMDGDLAYLPNVPRGSIFRMTLAADVDTSTRS